MVRSGSLAAAVAAQTRVEILLTLRRGENVLITLVVPVVLLVFFASLGLVPAGSNPMDFLLPGMLALAVISTSMVSLGIATAFERQYRVLKRLGGTPLPRGGLLAAKGLSVLVIEVVQVVLLVAIAAGVYGWRPSPGGLVGIVVLLLGTAAFAGIGLAMAGGMRAEATLAAANGLYLVFLLLGDIVLPISHLPTPLALIARVLPAAAFSRTLRATMAPGTPAPGIDALILVAWAVVAPLVASRVFRWE
jgi:ABC-2 type transport system permease protein